MATGRPVSLLKKEDRFRETYPKEPDRFLADHVDEFLTWAVGQGASDVTIQTDKPIYNEIHGVLYPATHHRLDSSEINSFLFKIYGNEALARLAGGKDLDLSYEVRPERNWRIRFRVNITAILTHGRDGAQITMRVLPEQPPSFDDLKIEKEIIEAWHPRQGLVLVTGPTGSGKSTLLASGIRMLMEKPGGSGKILTYEAPIEYTYDTVKTSRSLISQTEIPRHLPSFEKGVRNALRRKPNIILLGEARDKETISAAIEAGQTGHVVYSTVHTTGVTATLRRMISSFDPEERLERAYALMETLRLVITQALVEKKGGGRVGVREWLVFTDEIREALLDVHFEKWPVEIQRYVETRGQSMKKSASAAYKDELIERKTYLMLTQGVQ